jgi:hypothetical protein
MSLIKQITRLIKMKIFDIALLTFTMLALTNCADNSVADGTRIPNETIKPLATWVEQQTNVKMAALPITEASGMRLKTALGLEGVQQARAVAAYIPGQIIINNIIWDPESLVSQSYIVHELVHHAQLFSGRTYPCPEAKEREAYTLQNKWLVEHGESPIVSTGWIENMSECKVSSRQIGF